jgi:hypothetical protein
MWARSRAGSRLSFRLRQVRGRRVRVKLPPYKSRIRVPRPKINLETTKRRLRENLSTGPREFAPSIGVGSVGDLVYRVARLRELEVPPAMIAIFLRGQHGNKTPVRPRPRKG